MTGNLLQRIKAGQLNRIERRFPGSEEMIRIRLLTNQDILDAALAADEIFRSANSEVSMQNIKEYEAEKDTQRLYRAVSDMDGTPLAANMAEFRRLLTVADKDWLIGQYNELDAECNPAADMMPDAEFDALVEAVKKNPDTALNLSSTSTLRRLARFLALPPVNSPRGSGRTSQ